MVGDVDENMISRVDAQMLASQAQYFHTEPQGMNLIQTFNTAPQNFKYDDVIKCVETIGQWTYQNVYLFVNNSKIYFNKNRFLRMKRLKYEVFGKVQGVFFRKYTKKEADKLGISGWVMNTEKKTVIGEAEGQGWYFFIFINFQIFKFEIKIFRVNHSQGLQTK